MISADVLDEPISMESYSSPEGNFSWTMANLVSTESPGEAEDPCLVFGSDQRLHVVWSDPTDYGSSGTDRDIFWRRWEPEFGWMGQAVISTESNGDSYAPSMDVDSDGVVHIAWADDSNYAGSGTDRDIFYKTLEVGVGMTTTEVVSTESTTVSWFPSLAVGPDGTVHIAWDDSTNYAGSGTDTDIFYKKYVPGSGWTTTEIISTESTGDSGGPSLAVGIDGTVHIAWTDYTNYGGSGADVDIFYKKFVPGSGWTTTEVVSSESWAWSADPSLTVGTDGVVHVAWRDKSEYGAIGTDFDIFYKKYVPGSGWTTTEVVSTDSTDDSWSPCVGVGPNEVVHFTWMDEDDNYHWSGNDDDIFYRRRIESDSGLWPYSEIEVVSTEIYASSSDPCMYVSSDGAVHIAWNDLVLSGDRDIFYKKGENAGSFAVARGTNDRVYYRYCSWGVWDDWKVVPTGTTCDSPAAVVYDGRLYMVVRGMEEDNLWFGWINLVDDSFSGWSYISGETPSKPTLTRWGSTLVLVVRGTDDRVYYRLYSTLQEMWYSWTAVPTGTTSESPAAATDNGILHLVVKGMNGELYYQQFYLLFPYYTGWTAIGGITPSAPTLTGSYEIEGDTHTLYLLVRGKDNNGIYLRSYDGSWNNWQLIPGSSSDVFGAVVQPPLPRTGAALEIVRSMNGNLYHGKYDLNSGSFLGWTWISGETPSPPTLTN
jgi:hypothetical protein